VDLDKALLMHYRGNSIGKDFSQTLF